jgi:hypothetical protein
MSTSTDTVPGLKTCRVGDARIRAVPIFAMRSHRPAASLMKRNARHIRACRWAAVGFDRRRSCCSSGIEMWGCLCTPVLRFAIAKPPNGACLAGWTVKRIVPACAAGAAGADGAAARR